MRERQFWWKNKSLLLSDCVFAAKPLCGRDTQIELSMMIIKLKSIRFSNLSRFVFARSSCGIMKAEIEHILNFCRANHFCFKWIPCTYVRLVGGAYENTCRVVAYTILIVLNFVNQIAIIDCFKLFYFSHIICHARVFFLFVVFLLQIVDTHISRLANSFAHIWI